MSEGKWNLVENALREETPSGYKIAAIEARKIFIEELKNKNFPIKNDLKKTLKLFSYKFKNDEKLISAIDKIDNYLNEKDGRLSNFEAEDLVEIFKDATKNLENTTDFGMGKKIMISVEREGHPLKSPRNWLLFVFGFFLLIKIMAYTTLGKTFVNILVKISDFIFSWVLLLSLIVLGIIFFMIITFIGLDKRGTKIKSIKEK